MYEKFSGIVLYKKDYKEKDALIKILTPEFGKKMFFIKNYHRPNLAIKSALLPLTLNDYVGTINASGLSFITEGNNQNYYHHLQANFEVQVHAIYIGQLVDACMEDGESDPELFNFFCQFLEKLNQGGQAEVLTVYAEIFLLKYFGVHLNWKHCLVCQQVNEPFDFSLRRGGLLCQHHYANDPYRLHIHPRAMHVAYMLANIPLDHIGKINVSEESVRGLRNLMDQIYQEFVGIQPKSKTFLDQMRYQKSENILKKDQ